MKEIAEIKYEYHNVPIPGGGYVTGFIFNKCHPNILYARTDIGGTYRFSYEEKKWISLIDHVSMFDLSESYPIAIALEDKAPEKIYIASGINEEKTEGRLSISNDYGKTFSYKKIPCFIHGNWNGRGTGLRLIVDPNNSNTLYFASQKDGLLRTKDLGNTWETLTVGGEQYMTFVWISPKNGCIVVGTAGVTTRLNDSMRGITLYNSYDEGKTFSILPQPSSHIVKGSRMSGYVAQRYDYDGTNLYVTLANTGKHSYVVENGYSCDSGDVLGGRVIRYSFSHNGFIKDYDDITPNTMLDFLKQEDYDFGFSGISSCAQEPGLLVCSTICREQGDIIYISKDYGNHWEVALFDLSIGNLTFRAPYMKPKYNGNHSILHWPSDIKINPFNKEEAWFNSGTGVFVSNNLTSENRSFHDYSDGIEETVHLNLYSPPSGDVKLLDILGDLGGFAFKDLDTPCENTFADENGNRYITCINADYPDNAPDFVVVTPRGNWTGKTKGGLIVSRDQCKTFERLDMPFGISNYIDEKCREIERPNVNSGWVAVGADSNTIVWSIADNIVLPMQGVVVSVDQGKHFQRCDVYNLEGRYIDHKNMKVFSDRVNPKIFYGFGSESEIYISKDNGKSFYQYDTPNSFPKVNFGLIDCANKTEIRGNAGVEGEFYLAMNIGGLWKMTYQMLEDNLLLERITNEKETVFRVGLGIGKDKSTYLGETKTLFICGVINNQYGFYCSMDEGKNWERMNTKEQMFGDINSMEGDSRIFGRFFIATGSRGVLYGEPIPYKRM